MLFDLWNQRSVWDVADEYQVPRGFVQTLMTSAAAFSSCVLRFCEVRKYNIHDAIITETFYRAYIILSVLNSQAFGRYQYAHEIYRLQNISKL
jgi:hypothetical protein